MPELSHVVPVAGENGPPGLTGFGYRRGSTDATHRGGIDEEAELANNEKQLFRIAIGVTLLYICFGTGMYMWLADMTFLNALYFIIVTLTTIGKYMVNEFCFCYRFLLPSA